LADIIPTMVYHARTRPRRNAFRYGVFYLSLPLAETTTRSRNILFSYERFNLLSFFASDHGDGQAPLDSWIRNLLFQWRIPQADGEITLLTLPRILGYVFNPISLWFCRDREGKLRAVLAEVNNTFAERHCYLCAHSDRREIMPNDTLTAEKVFHVSPFIKVEGQYRFRFFLSAERLAVQIDLHDANGLTLSTGMAGKPLPLTAGRTLYYFFRYPLVTLKIMALIHYQAVKLFLKGVRHQPKPPPPIADVSQ
jgi:DUF1365 family protein